MCFSSPPSKNEVPIKDSWNSDTPGFATLFPVKPQSVDFTERLCHDSLTHSHPLPVSFVNLLGKCHYPSISVNLTLWKMFFSSEMNMIIHPHIETHYESIYCTDLHTKCTLTFGMQVFFCSAVKKQNKKIIKYITFNILLAINIKSYINKYWFYRCTYVIST